MNRVNLNFFANKTFTLSGFCSGPTIKTGYDDD